MPLIQVHLNTDAPSNLPAFQNRLSELVSQGLGKPEQYVMTRVCTNEAISFARTDSPAAYIELKSIGTMSPEQTQGLALQICTAVTDATDVSADRIYIEFADAERHLWGWNNKTFAS